jgi:hypothetical protein
VAGRVSSILTLNLTVMNGIGGMFGGRFGVFRTATRRHMTFVVSLRAVASSAATPSVDLQQEYLARARWPALSKTDAALANRRKALDLAGRIETFGSCRNEMIFEPSGPSCYSGGLFAAFMEQSSAKALATDDVLAGLFGGNLSNGMSAGV